MRMSLKRFRKLLLMQPASRAALNVNSLPPFAVRVVRRTRR